MAESIAQPTGISKHRIEALSAGIYAIAPTLLVLELRFPEAVHHTNAQALRGMLIELLDLAAEHWSFRDWPGTEAQGQQIPGRVVEATPRAASR